MNRYEYTWSWVEFTSQGPELNQPSKLHKLVQVLEDDEGDTIALWEKRLGAPTHQMGPLERKICEAARERDDEF